MYAILATLDAFVSLGLSVVICAIVAGGILLSFFVWCLGELFLLRPSNDLEDESELYCDGGGHPVVPIELLEKQKARPV